MGRGSRLRAVPALAAAACSLLLMGFGPGEIAFTSAEPHT